MRRAPGAARLRGAVNGTERGAASPADDEERRRAVVLAERARRRRRRRIVVGASAVTAAALIATGSVVAWGAQTRAEALAGDIDAWHEARAHARCELDVRIVRAVALQDRARDVLEAAEHVEAAEELLGDAQRTAFGSERRALLETLSDAGITDDDRAIATRWTVEAERAGSPESFDVLAACLEAAEKQRAPVEGVTAERADALARELRALGDPRDLDDSRIDALEAALDRLGPTALAAAESRAAIASLQALLDAVPEDVLAALRDADAHVAEHARAMGAGADPGSVLDLVEALTRHVAAAWMAEAWQLEAAGQRAEAAERAAAATAVTDVLERAAPRPVTAPPARGAEGSRPVPAPPSVPQPAPAPGPVDPAPAPVPVPAPQPPAETTAPQPPVETQPPAPTDPAPSTPPVDPQPRPPEDGGSSGSSGSDGSSGATQAPPDPGSGSGDSDSTP